MTDCTVRYFDGNVSTPHIASIRPVYYQEKIDGFIIAWQDKTNTQLEKRYFTKDCDYLPAVANAPHAIMLSDGARIEFLGEMPAWLTLENQRLFGRIATMEKRWAWIGASVVIMCAFVFGVFRFGIPYASNHIAQQLPDDALSTLGNQAQDYVMELTTPSKLPKARQDEIIALYDKLDGSPKATVIVRGGGDIGANALAIPNNTIVITDELIKLSNDDNEILAVLAHEQGHLVHRHSLKQAISSIGTGVLIVVITGDTSDLLLTLPTLLATAQYSQQAELEADQFAINELKRLNISPAYLASFFEKMEKELGDEHTHLSILSTHPHTDERIKQVKQHSP